MIAYLSLILLVAILAYFEARREKRMIDARPGGPDLDHKELIWRRLLNVGALVMVAVVFDGAEGWDALFMGLCHAGAAWGTFTISHRLTLNLSSGYDWRYVSPGNWYDFTAMVALGNYSRPHKLWTWKNWKECVMAQHNTGYELQENYRHDIHRAGLLAYCFEALVLALSCWGAIEILN